MIYVKSARRRLYAISAYLESMADSLSEANHVTQEDLASLGEWAEALKSVRLETQEELRTYGRYVNEAFCDIDDVLEDLTL